MIHDYFRYQFGGRTIAAGANRRKAWKDIGQGIFMFIVYIRIYIYTERSGVIADFTDPQDSLAST